MGVKNQKIYDGAVSIVFLLFLLLPLAFFFIDSHKETSFLTNLANSLVTILPFGEDAEKEIFYISEEEPYRSYTPTLRYDFKELHDDRLFLFTEYLSSGTYKYEYYVRVTTPGTFQYLPAIASELYFPENFGRTGGETFTVTK